VSEAGPTPRRLPPDRPPRWPTAVAAAGLIVAVAAVFGQVAGHELLSWDDVQHIVQNPNVYPPSWAGLRRIWTEPYWGLYAPVSYTWFAAGSLLAGRTLPDGPQRLDPAVFHLGNLLLHAASTLVVFVLLGRLVGVGGGRGVEEERGRWGDKETRRWGEGERERGGMGEMGGAAKPRVVPGPRPPTPGSLPLAAGAGALLFALHPVQVESVAWVSEARGLLCGLGSLVALWQYVAFWQAGSRRAAMLHYLAATAAFALALLSKPAAVAVPLMAGVLVVGWLGLPGRNRRDAEDAEHGAKAWNNRRGAEDAEDGRDARGAACAGGGEGWETVRAAVWSLGPWLVLAALMAVITKWQQPDAAMAVVPPLWARPLVAGDALMFYFYKLAAPWGLCPDYGRSPTWLLAQSWCYAAWLVPAAFLAALGCLRNRRVWLVAAGLSVAWLLPVLGLVPFDFQRISTVADRYLYLALLGPALALSWALQSGVRGRASGVGEPLAASQPPPKPRNPQIPKSLARLLTAALLLLLGALSFRQTAYWEDDLTLFAHTLSVNPNSVMANHNAGYALAERGMYEQAREYYLKALEIDPSHAETHLSLAIALDELGYRQQAERHLGEAFRLRPDWERRIDWRPGVGRGRRPGESLDSPGGRRQ
jgi:protein O-mannosyl-transferase